MQFLFVQFLWFNIIDHIIPLFMKIWVSYFLNNLLHCVPDFYNIVINISTAYEQNSILILL
jgi:phage-related protein